MALRDEMRMMRMAALAEAQGGPPGDASAPAAKVSPTEAAGVSRVLSANDPGQSNRPGANLPPAPQKDFGADF